MDNVDQKTAEEIKDLKIKAAAEEAIAIYSAQNTKENVQEGFFDILKTKIKEDNDLNQLFDTIAKLNNSRLQINMSKDVQIIDKSKALCGYLSRSGKEKIKSWGQDILLNIATVMVKTHFKILDSGFNFKTKNHTEEPIILETPIIAPKPEEPVVIAPVPTEPVVDKPIAEEHPANALPVLKEMGKTVVLSWEALKLAGAVKLLSPKDTKVSETNDISTGDKIKNVGKDLKTKLINTIYNNTQQTNNNLQNRIDAYKLRVELLAGNNKENPQPAPNQKTT